MRADSFTWDNGGGDSNWSTPGNWLGIPNNTVPGAGDNIFLGTAGSTATVDTTSRTVGSIVFNRSADFTINNSGGAGLFINTGISAASPNINGRIYTISAPIALGADNVWNVSSAAGATTLSVSGTVAGAHNLTKSGSGALVLTADNSGFSGNVVVREGILSLQDTSGAMASAAGFQIDFGGTLRLFNEASHSDNRIGQVDIQLNGGTLLYVSDGGSNSSDETVGRLLVSSGASSLSLVGSASSGGDEGFLAFNDGNTSSPDIVRSRGATLRFVDDIDASVSVQNHAEINGIIGGWMLWDDDDFAALSGINTGNIATASVDETSNNPNNWGSSEKVKLTNMTFTLSTNRTINSLILSDNDAETHTINSGVTLTLESGGLILNAPGDNHNKTIAGPGSLTAGLLSGYEVIVHTTGFVDSSTSHTIGATIINNGANSVSLTKSGVGRLILTGANSYTNVTHVSQGTLSLSSSTSNNNIGSSSKIIVHSGASLDVSGITAIGGFKVGTNQTLGGNGSVIGGVTADATGSKIAPGTSVGRLTFTGAGNITLNTNATIEMEIGGDGSGTGTAGVHYDQIVVSGASKVFIPGSATLKLVALPGLVYGQAYTLVSATNGSSVASGSFLKTLDGTLMDNESTTYAQQGLSFTIDYSSGAVAITFVPEPSAIGLILLGAPALLRRRRRPCRDVGAYPLDSSAHR